VRKRFQCLNRTWRGVRTADGWKYVCLEGQPLMMFDLNEDPYEMANLAFIDTFNEKREELQHKLAQWIHDTGDTFELPEL
jgi:arylsulfatase A-like enzyme